MNASPAPEPQITAPSPLWRVAAAFLHILHMLFGDPSDVAGQFTLTLKAHQLMATWLRRGEAMTRRLLLIEAQSFAKPNIRPLLRETRKHKHKGPNLSSDAPQKWRVSFRCFATSTLRLAQGDALCGAGSPVSVSLSLSKAERPTRRLIVRSTPPPPRTYVYRRRPNQNRYPPVLRQDRPWVVHQEVEIFRAAQPLAERYEALLRVFDDPRAYARRVARALYAKPYRAPELLRAPPDAEPHIDPAITTAAEASATLFNTS